MVAVIIDDFVGKSPHHCKKLLRFFMFHSVIHNTTTFRYDFYHKGIEQMKLCARLFCLLRRGAVEAQESLGKALRRFIAVLVGGVNDGQIRCLQLLRSERETAASEIFIGGHSGDKAECPMEVIVGHVYAGCHVGIVNVLINVFFHIVYCLLNQLY